MAAFLKSKVSSAAQILEPRAMLSASMLAGGESSSLSIEAESHRSLSGGLDDGHHQQSSQRMSTAEGRSSAHSSMASRSSSNQQQDPGSGQRESPVASDASANAATNADNSQAAVATVDQQVRMVLADSLQSTAASATMTQSLSDGLGQLLAAVGETGPEALLSGPPELIEAFAQGTQQVAQLSTEIGLVATGSQANLQAVAQQLAATPSPESSPQSPSMAVERSSQSQAVSPGGNSRSSAGASVASRGGQSSGMVQTSASAGGMTQRDQQSFRTPASEAPTPTAMDQQAQALLSATEQVGQTVSDVNSTLLASLERIEMSMQQVLQTRSLIEQGEQVPAEAIEAALQAFPQVVSQLAMDVPRLGDISEGALIQLQGLGQALAGSSGSSAATSA